MNSLKDLKTNFIWRFDPERNLDAVELQRFEKVTKLLGIQDGYVCDSYTMSAAGPVLKSLFIIGGGFIVEVVLQEKNLHFDVAAVKLMQNYRVKYSEHVQTVESAGAAISETDQTPAPIVTKFVQISLSHTENLHSELTFFGEGLDEWVAFCMKAFPPTHLLS